ncbi:heme exporter protein CcmD [Candidatus Accumulibacter sp. ACC003]|uniref:heme exporter protein CcmD n=1 Tax=Candidatus Accumulibacter sp. ACC003 TaxID=2823334 RepID=UPI0025B83136|nr:heme exporter protein CcmD [Candidatus Accumulibacter sp. ACC003]
MHWNSFGDFLAMGNHGLYVWGSLLVMALLMVAEPTLVLRGRRTLVERLRRQYRAESGEASRSRSAAGRRRND